MLQDNFSPQHSFQPCNNHDAFMRVKTITDYTKEHVFNTLKTFLEQCQTDLRHQADLQSKDPNIPKNGIQDHDLNTLHKKCERYLESFATEWDTIVDEFHAKFDQVDPFSLDDIGLVGDNELEQGLAAKKLINNFNKEQQSVLATIISGLEQMCPNHISNDSLPFLPEGLARCLLKAFLDADYSDSIRSKIEDQYQAILFPKVQPLYWGIKKHMENQGMVLDTHTLQEDPTYQNHEHEEQISDSEAEHVQQQTSQPIDAKPSLNQHIQEALKQSNVAQKILSLMNQPTRLWPNTHAQVQQATHSILTPNQATHASTPTSGYGPINDQPNFCGPVPHVVNDNHHDYQHLASLYPHHHLGQTPTDIAHADHVSNPSYASLPSEQPYIPGSQPTEPSASDIPDDKVPNDKDIPTIPTSQTVTLSNPEIEQVLAQMPTHTYYNQQELQQVLQQKLLASATDDRQPVLNVPGENFMNLVTLLFDFIKEEGSWLPDVEALIMQLQIAYMRLALLDEKLFEEAEHPARSLLNDVAELAGTIQSPEADSFQLVEQVVSEISSLQTVSSTPFLEQRKKIKHYIDRKLKPLIAEQELKVKTQAACDAQAEQLRIEAEQAVDQHVHQRIASIKTPLPIHTLIEKVWSHVIYDTYMQYPGDSKERRHTHTLLEKVLWSTGAGEDPVDRKSLIRLLPNILIGITHTINECQVEIAVKQHFSEELQRIHMQILQPNAETDQDSESPHTLNTPGSETAKFAKEIAEKLRQQYLNKQAEKTQKDQLHEREALANGIGHHGATLPKHNPNYAEKLANSKHKMLFVDSADQEAKSASIINLQTRRSQSIIDGDSEQALERQACSKEALNTLLSISAGTWMHYQIRGHYQHCKVAFYSPAIEKYTFIDRMGRKLFDRKRADLLFDIQEGFAMVIDQPKAFDRALESIINNIRATTDTHESASAAAAS